MGASCRLFKPRHRVAFVVGNDAYAGKLRLTKAVADARSIEKLLTSHGFAVHCSVNATKAEMSAAFHQFVSTLEDYSLVVLFYSGHGVEFNDRNFMVPVDANSCWDGTWMPTLACIQACRDNEGCVLRRFPSLLQMLRERAFC